MPPYCEGCLQPATHVCSGLDTPELYFCATCAKQHASLCADVRAGRSFIVECGASDGNVPVSGHAHPKDEHDL